MTTQLEAFRLIAPEFAGESDETVHMFLDMAPLYINAEAYPENQRGLALVLKAASLMLLRKGSASGISAGGALKREREGDLEREYAQSTSGGSNANLDIYAAQLKQLGASAGIGFGAAITRMANQVPTF